jgi:hypothetical protein
MAKSVASVVNTKRKEKGLLPRPVIHLIFDILLVPHVLLVHLVTHFVQISMGQDLLETS